MDTLTITFAPAAVPVSDDRGTVDGARYEVRDANGVAVASGLAIEPEGDSPGCWLDSTWRVLPGAVVDAIADSMRRGDLSAVSVDV